MHRLARRCRNNGLSMAEATIPYRASIYPAIHPSTIMTRPGGLLWRQAVHWSSCGRPTVWDLSLNDHQFFGSHFARRQQGRRRDCSGWRRHEWRTAILRCSTVACRQNSITHCWINWYADVSGTNLLFITEMTVERYSSFCDMSFWFILTLSRRSSEGDQNYRWSLRSQDEKIFIFWSYNYARYVMTYFWFVVDIVNAKMVGPISSKDFLLVIN